MKSVSAILIFTQFSRAWAQDVSYQENAGSESFLLLGITVLLLAALAGLVFMLRRDRRARLREKNELEHEQLKLEEERQKLKTKQERFWAQAAEELRTPLTVALANLEKGHSFVDARGLPAVQKAKEALSALEIQIEKQASFLGSPGQTESSAKSISAVSESDYPRDIPRQVDPQKANVLVTEDHPQMAQALVGVLADEYNVYFSKNGREGLDVLETLDIHCVLSDLNMPLMNGTDFISQIRQNKKWNLIPIIVLTSDSSDEAMIKHLKMGAQDYLLKPFHSEVLKARVHTQVETYALRNQMMASEKMASLGLLSAGIAHEMRNPLQSAQNLVVGLKKICEAAKKMASSDPVVSKEATQYFEQKEKYIDSAFSGSVRSLEKMNDIIQSIGGYASGSWQKIPLNMEEVIRSSMMLVEKKRKNKFAEITIDSPLFCDLKGYNSLHQAFVNVLENALDAMPEKDGKVQVAVKKLGPVIEVSFQDNGHGIPQEYQNRIFDYFMTTKEPGKGMGLGLSIVKDIVEIQHGGEVKVSSTKKGTRVRFLIPVEARDMVQEGPSMFHGLNQMRPVS